MSKNIIHTGRKYPDPVRMLPDYPVDYRYLTWLLRNYRSPRDKIGRMIKNGEIIRVKKGLYVLSPEFGGTADKKVLANLIYGPSYVSLEYALQYWGHDQKTEQIFSNTFGRFFIPVSSQIQIFPRCFAGKQPVFRAGRGRWRGNRPFYRVCGKSDLRQDRTCQGTGKTGGCSRFPGVGFADRTGVA